MIARPAAGIQTFSDFGNPDHPEYKLSKNVKIYGNVLEHNYIGSFFGECDGCLFANNTIVNCYQPLTMLSNLDPEHLGSNPVGLVIKNVPNSTILNNLFYNPSPEPDSHDNDIPFDVNFANIGFGPPAMFDYNYYTRNFGTEVNIRIGGTPVRWFGPNITPDSSPYSWASYRNDFPFLC